MNDLTTNDLDAIAQQVAVIIREKKLMDAPNPNTQPQAQQGHSPTPQRR